VKRILIITVLTSLVPCGAFCAGASVQVTPLQQTITASTAIITAEPVTPAVATAPVQQTLTAASTVTSVAAPVGVTGSSLEISKTNTASLSVTAASAPAGISGSAAAVTTTAAVLPTAKAKADIGELISIESMTSELNKVYLWWWNNETESMPSMTTSSAASLTTTAALGVTAQAAPSMITGSATALTATAALPVTASAAPMAISGSAAAMGLTSTSALSVTSGAKTEEKFYYNVYRKIEKQDYAKINKDVLTKEEYLDADVNTSTTYYYKIQVIDSAGNTHLTKAFSARTIDLVYPTEPQELKGFQDVETAEIKWTAGGKGTEAISGYNVYRGNTTTAMKFIAFVSADKSQYNDNDVDPGKKYFYSVRTTDISKRESKDSNVVSVVPFPLPRTGLILSPTAFRNDIFSNYGLNVDCMFSYYIGDIYGEHGNLGYTSKGTDSIDKVGVWLLTADAKWCLFNEWETFPSIAAGYMYTMLLQDQIGAAVNSNTTSVEQGFSLSGNNGQKQSFLSLSSPYFALSKKIFWDTTVHGGYMIGNQNTFLYYLSKYMPTYTPNNAYFVGISRPIFARMGLRVEYTGMVGNVPGSPWLINTHIDRLSSFDFAYFHFSGGYSILGYLSFRFTVFPTPYR